MFEKMVELVVSEYTIDAGHTRHDDWDITLTPRGAKSIKAQMAGEIRVKGKTLPEAIKKAVACYMLKKANS